MLGAGVDAFPAQDAFRVSMHARDIYPHGADVRAHVTVRASLFVDFDMEETDFIEWSEDRANRAEVPAPAALDQKDEDEKQGKDHCCDREEVVWDELPRVQDQNRDGPSEKSDRANIGEDEPDEDRGPYDKTEEYPVFHVTHPSLHWMFPQFFKQRLRFEFSCDLSRTSLQEPHRAGPRAECASCGRPEKTEDEERIEEEPPFEALLIDTVLKST